MAWTKAQQKVIDTRNKNLLVSAAAGSGKTAVLVERIISMISEGEHPADIDHLLIVTFTNAAAAEMRERIGKAIEDKLLKDPANQHLQKQISLLQSAQITTIHSFCLNVIRNYFHRIDLDPSFKIAEESEITLLKSDVISDLLERWYEEGSEEFHSFIESYSRSKSDAPVEELILQLYSFSMSNPWPQQWLADKRSIYEIKSVQEMSNAPWMKELLTYVHSVLDDLIEKNKEALNLCNEADGPAAYLPALLSDRSLLENLKEAASYEKCINCFYNVSFERLSSKKQESTPLWKKDRVKELREEIKKGIKDLTSQFFFQNSEEMLNDIQAAGKIMQVLFDLTLDFMDEFAKKKEEKNLIDFNDLEHFALKILVDEQMKPTQAAVELSEQFEEILIDEYQDSNMVQETILKSISREAIGKPNRFMVGDVKQSIYKFRLAMPEIFMDKYENYSCDDLTKEGENNCFLRIDLDKNFRSRKTVLDYVNQIFEQIMQKPVGGILYDTAAALKYGELYEETLKKPDDESGGIELQEEIRGRIATDVELLLVTDEENEQEREKNQDDRQAEDEEEAVYTKKEIEARAISRKIKQLTDPDRGMLVLDKKTGAYRPAAYRDIVILLRSMSNWSEVFVNTLMQQDIPAYADTGTGYFQTLEITTVLNMLRIIDNPRQDIPLAGVLYSPIGDISSTELAMIRADARNVSLYTALVSYAAEGSNEELKYKINKFIETLEEFRAMVNHTPIHELILIVLDRTGYYYYISALPGGERRKANIDMLVSQAVGFEKGNYSGLFHFIRYIEKLHKYEIDFGEAATAGEQDNTVRIMSIHKSKGLEFPIVFVAGMDKQFNTQDLRSNIILHSELGVGPEYIDSIARTKIPTLIKKVIQKKVQIENLGEELRVLYVAMTRAKEKLFLTGYLKSVDEIKARNLSFFEIMSAKCYMDWVLPATVNRIGWTPDIKENEYSYHKDGVTVTVCKKGNLLKEETMKQIFLQKDVNDLLSINPDEIYDQNLRDEVNNRLNYRYPYHEAEGIKVKMTVTELKKLGQAGDDGESINLLEQNESDKLNKDQKITEASDEETPNAIIPAFICRKEAVIAGTDRGTLYHKVLELIRLSEINSREDLNTELNRLIQENQLKESEIKSLNASYLYRFLSSNIAIRMKKAEAKNCLYREKQFVMGIKALEVIKESDSEELILIQGIIDVFFEEDNELVLLDYKSDQVSSEEQLVKRYKVQLEYYRKALERIFNKKVKELIIYSLPLGREIRID